MKKTKFTKLFVLILSLALLVGSVVGIASSADEGGKSYAIKSINIEHGDSVKVLIAVDADVSEAEDIEVKYTVGGNTYTATYWKNMTIYGETYPVFYTKGIAIKDCGEDVVLEAHTKGYTPKAPQYKNACVAEYLYGKLYRENYIAMTEADGLDNERKEFYLEMLDYIAGAQQVLWNDKEGNEGAQRTLVTERPYVCTKDATVFGLGKAGLLDTDCRINLTYTGTEKNFDGWIVKTYEGAELVSTDLVYTDSLNVSGKVVVEPFINTAIEDFDSCETGIIASTTGLTKDGNGKWLTVEYYQNASLLPENMTQTFGAKNTTAGTDAADDKGGSRITVPGEYLSIVDDGNGDNVLRYHIRNKETVLNSAGRHIGWTRAKGTIPDLVENSNVSIAELEVKFDRTDEGAGGTFGQFAIGNETAATFIYSQYQAKNDGVYLCDVDSGSSMKYSADGKTSTQKTLAIIPYGEYTTIRYEYFFGEKIVHVYVNDVFVGTIEHFYNASTAHGKMTRSSWNVSSEGYCDVTYRKINLYNTAKIYNENPKQAPVYQDFSGKDYVTTTVSSICTSDDYINLELGTGKFTYGASTEGYDKDTTSSATNYLFYKTDLSLVHPLGESYSNFHGARVDILEESDANKYLRIYSPQRISKCDRAHGMTLAPLYVGESDNVYVLEFDLRVNEKTPDGTVNDANPFEFIVRSKNASTSVAAQWNFRGAAESTYEDIILSGVYLGEWNQWNSIRMEMYKPEGDRANYVIQVYLKSNDNWVYSGSWTESNHDKNLLTNIVGKLDSVSICPTSNSAIDLDNLAFYTITKTYVDMAK